MDEDPSHCPAYLTDSNSISVRPFKRRLEGCALGPRRVGSASLRRGGYVITLTMGIDKARHTWPDLSANSGNGKYRDQMNLSRSVNRRNGEGDRCKRLKIFCNIYSMLRRYISYKTLQSTRKQHSTTTLQN